jgi:hypothetical protein
VLFWRAIQLSVSSEHWAEVTYGPGSGCRAKQRLGGLSKQGNPLLRFLWCEAAAHAVRRDPELRRFYRRKLVQKGLGKARVAAARKLGIRLWIMLRDQIIKSSVVVDSCNREAVMRQNHQIRRHHGHHLQCWQSVVVRISR